MTVYSRGNSIVNISKSEILIKISELKYHRVFADVFTFNVPSQAKGDEYENKVFKMFLRYGLRINDDTFFMGVLLRVRGIK